MKSMIFLAFALVVVVSGAPERERRSLGLGHNGAIVLGGGLGLLPGLALGTPLTSAATLIGAAVPSVAVIGPSSGSTAVVGPHAGPTAVIGSAPASTLIAGPAGVISTGLHGAGTIVTAGTHGLLGL